MRSSSTPKQAGIPYALNEGKRVPSQPKPLQTNTIMKLIKLWICALVALATFNLNVLAQRQKEPGKPQLTEEERSLQGEGQKEKARPDKPAGKKPSAKPGRPSPIKRGDNKPQRPERPERPELSEELKTKMETYKEESQALRAELKEAIAALEEPTREQISEATKSFRESNKDRFDAQKALSGEIRDSLKAARPERPERPEISPEAKALREKHQALLKSMGENKKELREALAQASEEERKELMESFREEQAQLSQELKALHKEIRESIGGARPEKPKADGKKPRRPRPEPGASRPGGARRPSN